MDLEKKDYELEWYDNPTFITTLLIGLILLMIILSQSFAVNSNMTTTEILRNVLNHNSVYLLLLVYFVALKTNVGKKYFNYLNVFLILLYFITSLTAVLSVFQSLTISNIVSLLLHVSVLIYLIFTTLKETRFWGEFNLSKATFNNISNDGYFYFVIVLSVILLAINLIASTSFDGVVIALFECIYYILFGRYIYLYKEYLGKKEKINKKEEVNNNTVKVVDQSVEEIKSAVSKALSKKGKKRSGDK